MSVKRKEYVFNIADQHLDSDEERRLFAQDAAMLAAAGAIDLAMEKAGITRSELARRLGRTAGFVSQVLSGSRNMTVRTLADFAYALGLQVRNIELAPVGEMRVSSDMADRFLDRGPSQHTRSAGVVSAFRDLALSDLTEQQAPACAA